MAYQGLEGALRGTTGVSLCMERGGFRSAPAPRAKEQSRHRATDSLRQWPIGLLHDLCTVIDATAATFHGRASPIKKRELEGGSERGLTVGV